jgi:hypothetical protein
MVAPKPKCHKQLQNIFLDDRGFLDQSDEYNHVLHNIDGGGNLAETLSSSYA